jgi:catechol 2,3-dioxygenase-like lactoylglutathione lyase family enzyme
MTETPVGELRLALTVADLEAALAFWRDALGLPEEAVFEQAGGRVVVLAAGRATIELLDENQAAHVDGIEVGRRVAPPVRVALRVADSERTAGRLTAAGATVLGGPVVTPWDDVNVRLDTPDCVQLTLSSTP